VKSANVFMKTIHSIFSSRQLGYSSCKIPVRMLFVTQRKHWSDAMNSSRTAPSKSYHNRKI
jgi:hypothetical protein